MNMKLSVYDPFTLFQPYFIVRLHFSAVCPPCPPLSAELHLHFPALNSTALAFRLTRYPTHREGVILIYYGSFISTLPVRLDSPVTLFKGCWMSYPYQGLNFTSMMSSSGMGVSQPDANVEREKFNCFLSQSLQFINLLLFPGAPFCFSIKILQSQLISIGYFSSLFLDTSIIIPFYFSVLSFELSEWENRK
jgi:hypothetical protein